MNTAQSPMTDDTASQVTHLVAKQTDLIARYQDLLDEIDHLIQSNQIENIQALLEKAGEFEQQLKPLEQTRQELLKRHYADGEREKATLLDLIKNKQLNVEVEHAYLKMSASRDKLQQSIQIVSQIVRKNRQRIDQSIRILSGYGNAAQQSGYSKKGAGITLNDNGREIAKA